MAEQPATGQYRPVARIVDEPLGMGIVWLEGVDYDADPALDEGVVLYVLDRRTAPTGTSAVTRVWP